jgi:hypothetical protein
MIISPNNYGTTVWPSTSCSFWELRYVGASEIVGANILRASAEGLVSDGIISDCGHQGATRVFLQTTLLACSPFSDPPLSVTCSDGKWYSVAQLFHGLRRVQNTEYTVLLPGRVSQPSHESRHWSTGQETSHMITPATRQRQDPERERERERDEKTE